MYVLFLKIRDVKILIKKFEKKKKYDLRTIDKEKKTYKYTRIYRVSIAEALIYQIYYIIRY